MDISTILDATLQRATEAVVDSIAKDGLVLLKNVLNNAGFSHSEYLKDSEVYSHVTSNNEVEFEIILDIEAVVPEDEVTKQALEEQQEKLDEALDRQRTYEVSRKTNQVRRLRGMQDARTPARDARTPARDARTTAHDRLIGHELARLAPRSARVTRTGKLSIALRRSIRNTEQGIEFPKDKFQGILNTFMDELKTLVLDKFSPELQKIVNRYVNE